MSYTLRYTPNYDLITLQPHDMMLMGRIPTATEVIGQWLVTNRFIYWGIRKTPLIKKIYANYADKKEIYTLQRWFKRTLLRKKLKHLRRMQIFFLLGILQKVKQFILLKSVILHIIYKMK